MFRLRRQCRPWGALRPDTGGPASIHDEPRDGLGDRFSGSPFTGLLREQSSREDRSIQGFDVSVLGGATLTSATLSGSIEVGGKTAAIGAARYGRVRCAGHGSSA